MTRGKRSIRKRKLLISVLVVSSLIFPVSQTLANDQKNASKEMAMGVQPTYRSAEESPYDIAMMQLSSTLREKIAADLAPVMVERGQIFDVSSEQSQMFFDDTENDSSVGEGAVRVIVQTAGRPDDELLFAVSARSFRRAVAEEQQGLRKTGKFIQTAHRFDSVDGFVAELTPAEICHLAARNDVIHISPDRQTAAMSSDDLSLDDETGATNVRNSNPTFTGTGIGIAFLDSGVDSANTALKDSYNISRVNKSVNFVTGETTTVDKHGHGTSVAGAAAGRVNQGLSGIAIDADLISVRVLNQNGQGYVSDAIRGLDWCVANKTALNIRVANLSLGASSVGSFLNDPLCQAVERAVGAGIVVVTAAGNNGRNAQGQEVYGSITSPGNDPLAITVGSANTYGTAYRSDETVNNFSSRGPTLGYRMNSLGQKQYDFVLKPDLIAPGNKIVTAKASYSKLSVDYPDLAYTGSSSYMKISGTSIASGVVAGAAAVLLQANPGLTPGLVKAILQYTAQPLSNANVAQQGAGLLNLDAAVKLAKALKTNASSLQPG